MLKYTGEKDINGNKIHDGDIFTISRDKWATLGYGSEIASHFDIDEVRGEIIPSGTSLNVQIKYTPWSKNQPAISQVQIKDYYLDIAARECKEEDSLALAIADIESAYPNPTSEVDSYVVDGLNGLDYSHGFCHIPKTVISSIDGERIEYLDSELATVALAGQVFSVNDAILIELSEQAIQFVIERNKLMDEVHESIPLKGELTHLLATFKRQDNIQLSHNFMPCDEHGEPCVYKHVTNNDRVMEARNEMTQATRTKIDAVKSENNPEAEHDKIKALLSENQKQSKDLHLREDMVDEVLMESVFVALFDPVGIFDHFMSLDCKFTKVQHKQK
ncbi:YopX family protein [Vibrio splendidus]|nr:YopX family protein [Vibrio splendidus]MCC4883035.1 YopX family protein [Vibrio splendidus]